MEENYSLGRNSETHAKLVTISTQNSSAHVEERNQELWGTWSKIVSDWFQQKRIKVFLRKSVCTRAVERAMCLACERVFP